ncbi:MAG TPA: CHASE2 domain-containing protein [Pyrinomonadaceae bacterium]|nr:CHASE2 domain-containing protein [Pyrinomonadaceae bacterium]
MKGESYKIRPLSQVAWIIAIIIVSTTVAMVFSWRAPGINLYARDRLMQVRGPLPPPDDIVIVSIDEASIARFGRFPWPRQLTARALDTISSAQPKAIAIDILYSEPTEGTDDTALAEAINRTGNTVVAAQLVETTEEGGASAIRWLRPLPGIEAAAAGVGHVHISTESDGEARELPLRKADDQGQALWSIAVETIRVGEGIRASSVRDVPGGVHLGIRTIPTAPDASTANLSSRDANSRADILRSDRMLIDYTGPPGSFSHQTFSFADVLDGRVTPQSFRGKYVLIGATAATLGDHVASPFVHAEGAAGEQHGELMPGVEVLANSMNTILRGRFYREVPDWLAALLAALVAASVLGSLAIAQGRFESAKQLGVLIGLLAGVLLVSYIAFVHWFIVPPVVPALISFGVAAPLALLRRSIRTSADLDMRVAELTNAGELFPLSVPEWGSSNHLHSNPASLIARLTGANTVAIYAHKSNAVERYTLVASHGAASIQSLTKDDLRDTVSLAQVSPHYSFTEDNLPVTDSLSEGLLLEDERTDSRPRARALMLQIGGVDAPKGVLLIGQFPPQELRAETLRLCMEIAAAYIMRIEDEETWAEATSSPWHLPRGIEWKARALGSLQRRLLGRARFVDRALRSVEDGLVVADISGRVAFSNPRAAEILGIPEHVLVGSDLFQRLKEIEQHTAENDRQVDRSEREMLMRLVIERAPVEREIMVSGAPPRYYMLRLSAVTSTDDGAGQILGLVAALSDVTQQHELQEMKSDVMALVTHELRTPLTAIQGMSEVLTTFEVDAERRRQMHLAINDEAKRLSRMINDYLDITKLESGARPLRLVPVRIAPLIERVLLLLDPLAAQREIRIVRRLAPNLPALLADADLIAQALTNLIANAIKYSPVKTEIIVEGRTSSEALLIEVADHGYGIPAEAIQRIFEKFYRVPRVEDADAPGTGMGLPLVREIIELHGGRVTVESEPGVGSTFSVCLPLSSRET